LELLAPHGVAPPDVPTFSTFEAPVQGDEVPHDELPQFLTREPVTTRPTLVLFAEASGPRPGSAPGPKSAIDWVLRNRQDRTPALGFEPKSPGPEPGSLSKLAYAGSAANGRRA